MKRDMELVRTILLKVEEAHEPMLADLMKDSDDPEERKVVGYHVRMLVEEDYLKGDDGSGLVFEDWYNLRLSWSGHEFLDTLRSDTVWEKSQGIAKQAGVMSAKALMDIGKSVAATLIAGALKQNGIGGP